jgi:hypothetical protein
LIRLPKPKCAKDAAVDPPPGGGGYRFSAVDPGPAADPADFSADHPSKAGVRVDFWRLMRFGGGRGFVDSAPGRELGLCRAGAAPTLLGSVPGGNA